MRRKFKVGDLVWAHSGHWYVYSEITNVINNGGNILYFVSALKKPVNKNDLYTEEEYYKMKYIKDCKK